MSEIVVRHTEPNDALDIKKIFDCKNVYSQTLQLPYLSEKNWEERVGNRPDHVYSFVAEVDGVVVGNLGLILDLNPRRRHVAKIGMGVKDDFIGQGVGSKLLEAALNLADNWLNIRRIELTVYTDNNRAKNLYEKYGFEVEGVCKDFAYRDGNYVSANYMARIKNV